LSRFAGVSAAMLSVSEASKRETAGEILSEPAAAGESKDL
jgi:hypothetical protein